MLECCGNRVLLLDPQGEGDGFKVMGWIMSIPRTSAMEVVLHGRFSKVCAGYTIHSVPEGRIWLKADPVTCSVLVGDRFLSFKFSHGGSGGPAGDPESLLIAEPFGAATWFVYKPPGGIPALP